MDDIKARREKKKLKKELSENNWAMEVFEDSHLKMMVYCYDHFDTGEMHLAGLRQDDIDNLTQIEQPMDVICGAVGSAFIDLTQANSGKLVRQRSKVMGAACGLYAVNTETFTKLMGTTKNETQHRHFIILMYRNKFTKEFSLRPFSLISEKSVLSTDDIKRFSQPIIQRDEEFNPGFFCPSPVIALR